MAAAAAVSASDVCPATVKVPLTAGTHAAIGAFSGLVEVTLLHPTVAWKNSLQEGRPLPLSPRALYRGYLLNASSFVPITCLQFGVNRTLESLLAADGAPARAAARLNVVTPFFMYA